MAPSPDPTKCQPLSKTVFFRLALSGHADVNIVLLEQVHILLGCILNTLVAVMNFREKERERHP
jgi:hypothetical protein